MRKEKDLLSSLKKLLEVVPDDYTEDAKKKKEEINKNIAKMEKFENTSKKKQQNEIER